MISAVSSLFPALRQGVVSDNHNQVPRLGARARKHAQPQPAPRCAVVAWAQPDSATQNGTRLSEPVMRQLGRPATQRPLERSDGARSQPGDTAEASTSGREPSERRAPSERPVLVRVSRPLQPEVLVRESAARLAEVLQEREQAVGVITDGPADLNVTYASFAWAQEDYNERLRGLQIWHFVLTLRLSLALLEQKWSYIGGYSADQRSARARRLAAQARDTILRLGPTFIKAGQLICARNDLLSPEFVDELLKLQDRVPAFSSDQAIQVIEAQLGQPVTRLFKTFQRRPIAAASLGQVHRATLWNDEEVVVKVQRPGLKRLFDIDLQILQQVAAAVDRDNGNNALSQVYNECAQALYQELDYLQEGKNAARFKRNFRKTPWVKVPAVEWQLSSPRVLTLEYLPGVKLADVVRMRSNRVDGKLVAQRATEAFLMQVLEHGFFHTDPQPANFAVDRSGNLIYYHFAMMAATAGDVKERLLEVFRGTYADADRQYDALIVPQVVEKEGQGRRNRGGSVREHAAAASGQFRVVLRALSTLEGISRTLDSEYQFSRVAAPYALRLLELNTASGRGPSATQRDEQQALEAAQAAASMPQRVQEIESTLSRMEERGLASRDREARQLFELQAATLNTIALFGCLQLGTTFALNPFEATDSQAIACFAVSLVFAAQAFLSLRRAKRLGTLDKEVKKQ